MNELIKIAASGLRARRGRALLSALGIAIGAAAMVGVLGISASSQAGVLAQIDELGTNLLTARQGQNYVGEKARLPAVAPGMVARIPSVTAVTSVARLAAHVYRNDHIPAIHTGGLTVEVAEPSLLSTLGGALRAGQFLSGDLPEVVLGASAAANLGIDRIYPGERVWLGDHWFYVKGILQPLALAPELDGAALVGPAAARRLLGHDGTLTAIYLRSDPERTAAVQALLARTVNPNRPSEVSLSRPSDALVARAVAKTAFAGLFLGLGALTLVVGGVGVANIMVIAVLERRSEIGLRRALGATRGQIRVQFIAEATLLSGAGGLAGCCAGALVALVYGVARGWAVVVPLPALGGALGASLAIGAVAGLLPAIRAARQDPTTALRTA
ncbi:ABC transporter permease [Nonomuraea sp. NPDC050556]|uniref:ABC transporter permease n=1 Tax=Nonomuraea sp. NPDC050556 TaxID=3364369 RepID=UPI00378AE844